MFENLPRWDGSFEWFYERVVLRLVAGIIDFIEQATLMLGVTTEEMWNSTAGTIFGNVPDWLSPLMQATLLENILGLGVGIVILATIVKWIIGIVM